MGATAQLAQRFPAVEVNTSALYSDHGDVLTSAGTASAIDACLHIVRSQLGSSAAVTVARHLVVAPHREEWGIWARLSSGLSRTWAIDRVARTCGFRSVVTFRQNFASAYGLGTAEVPLDVGIGGAVVPEARDVRLLQPPLELRKIGAAGAGEYDP